jgi:hypothetical protein
MQPRTISPQTERLVEPEATVPKRVYNMIEAITAAAVSAFRHDPHPVALIFRSNNRAMQLDLDQRVSGNAVALM